MSIEDKEDWLNDDTLRLSAAISAGVISLKDGEPSKFLTNLWELLQRAIGRWAGPSVITSVWTGDRRLSAGLVS